MLKRNLFTLVELLVVIGIIAILAGMILPAVVGAQQQGRITQAKSDMSAIIMALKGVENTYGKMVTGTKSGTTTNYKFDRKKATDITAGIRLGEAGTKNSANAYDAFIAELSVPAQKKSGGSFVITTANLNTNKRRITFLDPQSGYDPSKAYSDSSNLLKLWRDPWGSQYCVKIRTSSSDYMIDSRYDSEDSTSSNAKRISSDVAIYSFGPNAEDNGGRNVEHGDEQKSDEKSPPDDIISWE